ncbi:MAG: pyridoxal phosphate-dependent aminotransferase, partial [Bacteroidales bacterium]
ILKACNEGSYNYLNDVKEYGEKAAIMKKMFLDNGFVLVYDKDEDKPLADGFYFTIAYPGMTGEELLQEFLYYGISAISLNITGSERTEGLRACVSLVNRNQFPILEERLKLFKDNH